MVTPVGAVLAVAGAAGLVSTVLGFAALAKHHLFEAAPPVPASAPHRSLRVRIKASAPSPSGRHD